MRELLGATMTNRLCFVVCLTAFGSFAQDFDGANRSLQEKSFSRACDSFTAFLKANPGAPQAREATAKRAFACISVGKGSYDELRKLADEGEKDFARAWALSALFERGDRQLDPALPLLKQAASGEGRTATEARALLVRNGLLELERNTWNVPRVELMCELVLAWSPTEPARVAARFARARARINNGVKLAEAEQELVDLGAGASELADDALYLLGQRRESERKFVAALERYDSIVKRFSPTTSNMRSAAESRAADIRRPSVSVGASYTELPGVKPSISVSWRNVKNATWTLTRVAPLAAQAGDSPDGPASYLKTATGVVSTWSSTLEVPSPHEPGTKQFDLDLKDAGMFVLTVDADGQRSQTWVLVTQTAVVAKTDGRKVVLFVADAETGAAKPGADVALFTHTSSSGGPRKLTGRTNADGVATFELERTTDSMYAWTKSGSSYAFTRAGNAWSASWSREQLAYVQTDRPLYKPGETVGFKVYLRTREGGPSSPLANKAFTLRVTDVQGKQVVDEHLTTNEFGTATLTFSLPKNAPLGAWQMYVYANDVSYRQDQRTFRVEEYKPPESTVSIEALGSPKPGEPVRLKVKATFLSGGAIANAQGRALVTVRPWQHQWGPWPLTSAAEDDEQGDYEYERRGYRRRKWNPYGGSYQLAQHTLLFKTGADGTAELTVPLLDQKQGFDSLEYAVQAFVTDASRREVTGSGSVKVASAPYFVDVRTSHDIYRPGERVAVDVRAEDANGRPVAADVVVRLSRLTDQGAPSRVTEVRTRIIGGKGSAVLDADAIGEARVEVFDATATPERSLAQTDLWLTSDTRPLAPTARGFALYVDRAPLKAGDRIRALVATTRPGGHALVTIESDGVHALKVIELKGPRRLRRAAADRRHGTQRHAHRGALRRHPGPGREPTHSRRGQRGRIPSDGRFSQRLGRARYEAARRHHRQARHPRPHRSRFDRGRRSPCSPSSPSAPTF
jgi:hypothetical protein